MYHMGIYADPQLLDWFKAEYPKHSTTRLDMGKSLHPFTPHPTAPPGASG